MALIPSFAEFSSEEEVACCADACGEQDGPDEPDKDCDICNPFYSCACFSGFLINYLSFELPIVKCSDINNIEHSPSFPVELNFSIWQPPKISA